MLIAHYRHRLPADYDLDAIRARVAARGPTWDDAPGLIFKAFTLGERRAGAQTDAYASLYLWRDAAAAADFLAGPGFAAVVAQFGRPVIETWLSLALDLGGVGPAAALSRADRSLPEGADIGSERLAEREQARARIAEGDARAVIVGLDPAAWRLTRFTLAAAGDARAGEARCGTILHLAAPGLSARSAPHP